MPLRAACPLLLAALLATGAGAAEPIGPFVLADRDGFRLTAGLEAGVQFVWEDNLFWRLSDSFAPGSGFNPDRSWFEAYAEPSLSFEYALGAGTQLYGRGSVIASVTLGEDAFDTEGGRVAVEDLFAGIRFGTGEGGPTFDVSVGSQPYDTGNRMLIADGGGDGFERGALIFGPRAAWELTAIARAKWESTALELFFLDPRELQSGDTDTRVAGVSLTHRFESGSGIGFLAGLVPESEAPWVQAPPGGFGAPVILPGGREGLRFFQAWGTFVATPSLSFSGDLAIQSNPENDQSAWAARVKATYVAAGLPFRPVFGYTYQTFSGDDAGTPELERFDPLFYDGSPAAWGSGANASLVFLNTNVQSHQLSAALTLSPRDFLTFRYFHVRANELGSPLQFGQATRPAGGGASILFSGVSNAHLADDIYVEYTRVLTPNAFLTLGGSISFPGEGVRRQRRGENDVWLGAYGNLVVRF